MGRQRLEAFSDAVFAIIITIMVLELRPPQGTDLAALQPLIPTFLSYVLSFVYLGIYWNNHHHMMHLVRTVTGPILWANLHLLFWMSLTPFATAWLSEGYLQTTPVALYGALLLMNGLSFTILTAVLARHEGPDSQFVAAIGKDLKGKLSVVFYATAIGLAFVLPIAAIGVFIIVSLMWLIPDRRVERTLGVK